MKTALWVHIFEWLVHSWQNCSGRIRGCDLVGGGVSLDVGLEISKAYAIIISLSLSHQMQALSYCSITMPACCHASHCDGDGRYPSLEL